MVKHRLYTKYSVKTEQEGRGVNVYFSQANLIDSRVQCCSYESICHFFILSQ